jgi:hypothetical protein
MNMAKAVFAILGHFTSEGQRLSPRMHLVNLRSWGEYAGLPYHWEAQRKM